MSSKQEKAVERHMVQLAENMREAIKAGVLTIWTHGADGVTLPVHQVDLVLEGDDPPHIDIEIKPFDFDPLEAANDLTWNEVVTALVAVKEDLGFETAKIVVARHLPEGGSKLADIKLHPDRYAALRDDARAVHFDQIPLGPTR